jgi:hypothetical protein
MFYSKSSNGFYSSEINNNIPNDAVQISIEKYHFLLNEQSNNKEICSDSNGLPILVDKKNNQIDEINPVQKIKDFILSNPDVFNILK